MDLETIAQLVSAVKFLETNGMSVESAADSIEVELRGRLSVEKTFFFSFENGEYITVATNEDNDVESVSINGTINLRNDEDTLEEFIKEYVEEYES